jgi:hypothetical protein
MSYEDGTKMLCQVFLLPRILPVCADFFMSSTGGNENNSDATAERSVPVVRRKTLKQTPRNFCCEKQNFNDCSKRLFLRPYHL